MVMAPKAKYCDMNDVNDRLAVNGDETKAMEEVRRYLMPVVITIAH